MKILIKASSVLLKLIAAIYLLVFISACAHHSPLPDNTSVIQSANKTIDIPTKFDSTQNEAQSTQLTKSKVQTFSLDSDSLLNGFNDAILQELILQGLKNNPNLAATATRILDAQAQARITKSQRLPNLNVGATAGRNKNNFGFTTFSSDTYSLGINTQWELDIWLKLRDQNKASLLEIVATENDLVFAQLSLAANISRSYFNLLAEQELLTQTAQSTKNITSLESIAVRSFKRGLVTALDVQLARRDLANAKRSMTAQENLVNNAIRNLNILVGNYPNSLVKAQITNQTLPDLTANLQAGIPSSVLANRPDLLATEIRLKAADLQVKVARKNLLPSIALTGNAGTSSSSELSDLLDSNFSVWSILGNLTYPLLNRAALKSNISFAENSLERITYNYANQVLNAFNEVESGLDSENSLRKQYAELTEVRDYAQASSARAKLSYEKGLVEANTLLSTELQLLSAEQSLIRTKNQLLQNRINLVLALGGGLKPQSQHAIITTVANGAK